MGQNLKENDIWKIHKLLGEVSEDERIHFSEDKNKFKIDFVEFICNHFSQSVEYHCFLFFKHQDVVTVEDEKIYIEGYFRWISDLRMNLNHYSYDDLYGMFSDTLLKCKRKNIKYKRELLIEKTDLV